MWCPNLIDCVMCGCVMSPTSGIYWVELDFINNYKESQLWLVLLRYSANVASVFSWVVTDIVSSPSYRVKQLKVEISKSFTTHEFIELGDSLLWISPHLELLLMTHGEWIDKNWYRETISFKVLRILISLEFINLLHIFSLLGMVNKF